MIPAEKIEAIVSKHNSIEKELSSGNIEHKNFADLGSDNLKVRARAQFIFGKYLGGSMIEIFEKNKTKANEMVTNMILYAGSRAKSSSPHWKASDISSF